MMNRGDIIFYVRKKYNIEPDYPWVRTPDYAILRQKTNGKWFGAILAISQDKLGLEGSRVVDVLNLKCDPLLTGSLRQQEGIFPAYHMNKEHWITILLGSAVSNEQICELIDLSYRLTV